MGSLLQIVPAVLLLVVAGASVVGYFRANVSKSTIELYKADNEALRARVLTLESQALHDSLQIRELKGSVDSLQAVVTQADAIASMRGVVERIAVKVGA